MKKFKILFIFIILFSLTGCFNNDSMDDISITTSIYPIEYVVKSLYGEHSTINSLYPKDTDASNFEVTNVLLDQYSNNDLFIFNGLTEENSYVNYLLNKNKNLKIIDVTSNMQYDYSIEELWLDPNNLLTIANNIRKGFKEYIRIINGLKEGKEDSELVVRDYQSRDCAKILYDSFVSFLSDPYAFSEYIAKETGFDLEDEFESRQFNVYMEHAKRIMNENDVSSKNLVDCTKEEIEKSRKIVNEFSRLCQDGKASYDDEEKVFEKRNKNS